MLAAAAGEAASAEDTVEAVEVVNATSVVSQDTLCVHLHLPYWIRLRV